MKKYYKIISFLSVFAFATFLYSCAAQKQLVENKSGAQLWAENCVRCHNTPSPVSYNNPQWDVIGLHMRVRANLTGNEAEKIIEFLKTANN